VSSLAERCRSIGARRGRSRLSVIEVNRLTKRFGKTVAVDDLSFAVERGRITGFLGPNGAGKTTTLRILLGLVAPTGGGATILGRPYRALEDPARRVGAVLEATGYHPTRSGRNHLRTLAAATGAPQERVDEVLALVRLEQWGRRKVKTYSLGMRQRLSLACALLGDPEVLVLDEPANGLDPEGIRWLRDLLRSLSAEGRTILISSHVLAEIAQTVDEVAIIHHGRLLAHAPLDELTTGAAGGVRVRTPETERLRGLLIDGGLGATIVAPDRLAVAGTPERVGEIAAENGVVLHELRAESSLEEVFLELTAGEEEART
jgi:ABC-2 type transport system ATP-binding protein